MSLLSTLKYLTSLIAIHLCGLIFAFNIFAQTESEVTDDDLVRWTPSGMVVFASEAALSEEIPVDGRVQSVVYRKIGDESSYREIARLQRADSWEEFLERADEELIEWFRAVLDITTDEEIWEYIKQNPRIENYGFYALDRSFWRAFGTAYFDEETVDLPEGETVSYQIRYILADGSESEVMHQGSEPVGKLPNMLPPRNVEWIEQDSLAGGSWVSPLEGSEDAFYAQIYRQTYPDGDFQPLPNVVSAQRSAISEGDSVIVYQVRDNVEPEQAYRYYIQPLDMFGTPGPPSDTLMVISVDFNNLPLMGQVTAKDTTSGIHLSWEPVPDKPYISGIEIQRSRRVDQGFVTLDTLHVTKTEYLDTQLVPNQPYHYRFRIVTIRESDDLPSATVSASYRNEDLPPSTPYGLRAEQEGPGIRLNWDSVAEHDLFGYYVYRGTSRQDSMAVISRAIQDTTTFFDNSPELHGRTNYVYAVKAVNMSDLVSDFSNTVAIRPDRIVRPPAPVGMEGYAEQKRVRLFWKDQKRRDKSVAGYHVYRSKTPMEVAPDSTAAAIQAEQADFEKMTNELITTPAFDDKRVESGETYYYAVSSVDVFGVESVLSNTARFTTERPALRPPSQVNVRNVSDGVEIRWNRTMQNDVSQYRIYRRERGSDTASLVTSLPADETRFTDQNISSGTVYWYSIQVAGGGSESRRSTETSVHSR